MSAGGVANNTHAVLACTLTEHVLPRRTARMSAIDAIAVVIIVLTIGILLTTRVHIVIQITAVLSSPVGSTIVCIVRIMISIKINSGKMLISEAGTIENGREVDVLRTLHSFCHLLCSGRSRAKRGFLQERSTMRGNTRTHGLANLLADRLGDRSVESKRRRGLVRRRLLQRLRIQHRIRGHRVQTAVGGVETEREGMADDV